MKPEGLIYQDLLGTAKAMNDDGTLECTISTDAIDRMGEVLDPNGVDLKNYKQNPVVLWAHDYSTPPIGKAQWVKRSGNTIISKVKFAPTPFAQEVKLLYEQGFMKTFSVGFIPKSWEDGDGEKNPRRTYKDWELLEYSAVPVPANPEALAMAMSKGVIKSPEWNKFLPKTRLQEFDNEKEETIEKVSKEADSQPTILLDDLTAENGQLTNQVKLLQDENAQLRYKLYESLKQNQTSLSEITAKNVVKEIEDVVRGVIRKAQGKID